MWECILLSQWLLLRSRAASHLQSLHLHAGPPVGWEPEGRAAWKSGAKGHQLLTHLCDNSRGDASSDCCAPSIMKSASSRPRPGSGRLPFCVIFLLLVFNFFFFFFWAICKVLPAHLEITASPVYQKFRPIAKELRLKTATPVVLVGALKLAALRRVICCYSQRSECEWAVWASLSRSRMFWLFSKWDVICQRLASESTCRQFVLGLFAASRSCKYSTLHLKFRFQLAFIR